MNVWHAQIARLAQQYACEPDVLWRTKDCYHSIFPDFLMLNPIDAIKKQKQTKTNKETKKKQQRKWHNNVSGQKSEKK